MKNLSFIQEFFLCALKPEGNMSSLKSVEISTCIVAGGVLALLIDNYILIDANKKVQVVKELDAGKMYLEPLYHYIKDSKAKTVEGIAESYIFSSNKKYNKLIQVLASSLEDGYVELHDDKGLLRTKTTVVPIQGEQLKIIEKLRAEFLEEGSVSEETLTLGVLLLKSGLIKRYFSKFEADRLKERLEELKKSDAGIFIKKIVDYIDTLITIIAAM